MAYNLLKQVKTFRGKLNCYVVDSLDDLESLSSREEEIIGCRAFSISNGKFYIMNSQKEWHEAIPVFNTSLQDTVTRKGVYTWTFDPTIHDGIQEIEVEFIPTLQEFEETITRSGDYTFNYDRVDYDGFDDITIHVKPTLQEFEETITRSGDYTFNYDRVDYDGFDDITIHVKPTLQEIEEDIEEGGDYEYTFDPENYDGLSKVILHVSASGSGDKVAVDFTDEEPDYLINKLATTEGSGIKITFNPESEKKQMLISYSPADFEADYLETLPLASIQGEDTPTYQSGSITLIGSSFIPSNGFSFAEDHTVFTAYSSSGDMTNCRFLVFKVNSDNSATVIAYSKLFSMSAVRNNNKIQALCEHAVEKIKAGERYYIGLAGTAVTTDWAKMMGYRAWAAQEVEMTPPFNIYSTKYINMSNPLVTLSPSDLVNNGSFYVYYSITK